MINLKSLPFWMHKAVFRRGKLETSSGDIPDTSVKAPAINTCHPLDANLVCSDIVPDQHYVLLDLDVPHKYIESSTTGHAHLYIDKVLAFQDYLEVLQVLSKHGIVEEGFYKWTMHRGYSSLRPPGIEKHSIEDNNLLNEVADVL